MSGKETTSAVYKNGERTNKGLLPTGAKSRIDKLKPKALDALCRKILKEETKTDSPYRDFLPDGITNRRKVYRFATRTIKDLTYKYLELPSRHNQRWTSENILDVVLDATVRNSCIEDASNSLNLRKPRRIPRYDIEIESTPNGDTVLRRIKTVKTDEWMGRFEKANTELLKTMVKSRVLNGLVWFALDITPWMYYGDKNTKGIMGTKRKAGTNFAYKFMTICVTAQREHVTLAGSYMTQLMNPQNLMKELLLKSVKYTKGTIRIMCDREFFTVPYIKVLEELNAIYLMPAKENTRIIRIIKETKTFPRVIRYSMGPKDDKVELSLILAKSKEGEVHTFATNMNVDEKNAEDVVEFYRNRWTIETSYRMLSEVRARTCSRNFTVRWFLVLFGLLVRNGYYLLNETIIEYGHVTLKTFTELVSEIRLKDKSSTISTEKGDG